MPNYFRRIRRQMQNLIFHFDTRIPAARRIVDAIDLVDLYSNIVFASQATTSEFFLPHQCLLWSEALAELEASLHAYPATHSDRRYFRQVHQCIAGIRADFATHHPNLCTQEPA